MIQNQQRSARQQLLQHIEWMKALPLEQRKQQEQIYSHVCDEVYKTPEVRGLQKELLKVKGEEYEKIRLKLQSTVETEILNKIKED
jgi:hypothetical protein